MDQTKYAALFLTESREHLSDSGRLLLAWEQDPQGREPVDGLFRAFHTIKGMAAAMGYGGIVALSHAAENLLDAVRQGGAARDTTTIDLMYRSVAALEAGMLAVKEGQEWTAPPELVHMLEARAVVGKDTAEMAIATAVASEGGRLIRVEIDPASSMRGARAMLVLKRAAALGALNSVQPAAAALSRDGFDGRLSFRLATAESDARIAEVIRSAGDVLTVGFGDERTGAERRVSTSRHVRVDLGRLDAMMALIGELVTTRNRLAALIESRRDAELADVSDRIGRLAERLQGDVMQARLTPVGQVFARFPRVVRDLAQQLGKDVVLDTEGAAIELDRAMLDEIADPVLHLLRNAVDHGVEFPHERLGNGKPAQGRIVLSAIRDRNTVAIRVADDGRGIDRARVLAKARAKGMAPAGARTLSDEQLLQVIGRPGFSTAEQVSHVSGRGVGIDVVLTRARAIGATVELSSQEGHGTTFTLRLPLTLAILRAFLVRSNEQVFAVPLTFVRETLDLAQAGRRRTGTLVGDQLQVRDESFAAVPLRALLQGTATPAGDRAAVVLEAGQARSALIVDQLLGQQELVVEPFPAPKGMPVFIGGATILGDGRPALILDPTALLQGRET